MSKLRAFLLGGVLLLVVLIGVVFADGRAQSVQNTGVKGAYSVSAVTTAYRTDILAGDNADAAHATVIALEKVYCGGHQTVTVVGHFTVASATAVVRVVRYTSLDTVASESTFTMTAAASGTDGRSRYMSVPQFVDTISAPYVRILVATPSSGAVDVWQEVN